MHKLLRAAGALGLMALALFTFEKMTPSVQAGILSYQYAFGQDEIGGTSQDNQTGTFSVLGTLPQFNPALGKLTGVTIGITGAGVNGSIRFIDQNTNEGNPFGYTSTFSSSVNLSEMNGAQFPVVSVNVKNDPFTVYEYDNPNTKPADTFNGITYPTDVTQKYTESMPVGLVETVDPSLIPSFVGTGNFTFKLSGQGQDTFFQESNSTAIIITAGVGGLVDLTYTFVPEINIALVGGLALLAGTVLVTQRKRLFA